ncbi:MAG TPA: hypothetical protein VHJ17_08855, partial [Thermomonospora sp.]|nr:hypothetical protein [Thermomonospora sp.]
AVAAGAVLYGMDGGGGASDEQTVSPSPVPSGPSAARPTPTVAPGTDGKALAARIERSALRRPGVSFVHRQTGAGTTVSARGTFRVMPGREASYSMLVSGGSPKLRRATQTVLVGSTGYVRVGRRWQTVPGASRRTDGYAPLAARVRAMTSVDGVTALLERSTALDGGARGYRGVIPAGQLGAPYAELVRLTGARQAGFVVTLDGAGLPRQVRVTLGGGPRAVTVQTTYTGWGRRVTIKAPR